MDRPGPVSRWHCQDRCQDGIVRTGVKMALSGPCVYFVSVISVNIIAMCLGLCLSLVL